MNFDHLNERYTIVKLNLHFDKVTLIGLTELCIPVRMVVCTAVAVSSSHLDCYVGVCLGPVGLCYMRLAAVAAAATS